jgi:hypothetical protein
MIKSPYLFITGYKVITPFSNNRESKKPPRSGSGKTGI